jgi:hypothetical protein
VAFVETRELDRRRFGLVGDRFVWRLTRNGLRIWDASERRQIAELNFGDGASGAVGARDGRTLYVLTNEKDAATSPLRQVDLASGRSCSNSS